MEVSGNKPKSNGMGDNADAPAGVGVRLGGGAAIVAPVSAFPNGVPGNALIVLPVTQPTEELKNLLEVEASTL